jgi:hypothetical protein
MTLSAMQEISCWSDVTPFAGRVVAYNGAHQGYTLEDQSIRFGYVSEHVSHWDCGEKGYRMTRLLNPTDPQGPYALVTSKLKSPLSMRLASRDEITLIGRAIVANEARFEHLLNQERIGAILDRHLARL